MSTDQATTASFPIVGIGASAGGLEAFGAFFDAMPPASGMAFVLIQHLPPQRDSLLADILSKHTTMPVMQVEDGIVVEPDHVYVIRPGNTMTLEAGRLRLGEPVEDRGHRRPVDDFFRSLAREKREKSIAIIMSGMGSNGTAGAQEIKAAGGICIAQNPESAQFPSMPQHLIDAGFADQILPTAEIPDLLIKYVHHPYMTSSDGVDETETENALRQDRHHFNEILTILRTRTNYEFSGYKKPTLHRRLQRRMGLAQITKLVEYVQLLRQKSEEVTALATDLMINVTGFFRDPEAWEALRTQVIAPLVENRSNGQPIRVWVTACATGEEAYSMAMLLVEEAERAKKHFNIKIFATDAGEPSLAHARVGVFPGGIEGAVSLERLDRFFEKLDQVYRIRKEIREMVVFAPHNLLNDPPFSRLDIASCRNLLIYLEPDLQRRVISLLHFALREGGCLFLGNSETIGTAEQLYQPLNKKWRLYRRIGSARHAAGELVHAISPRNGVIPGRDDAERPPEAPLAMAIQKTLIDRYTPPAVVIDRQYNIIYYHGATPIFLSQPSGEPTSNLLSLCGDGLRAAVRLACREAMTENRLAKVPDGRIETDEGRKRVQVAASPLGRGWAQDHFLVCFEEVPETLTTPETAKTTGSDAANLDIARQLDEELRNVREELQSTIEEMESSNEELKASNEEVTSINEELQSTNEELETSKEELQSLNEELTTVNSQLESKIEELEGTTNDLSNLLSSTNIAVVFLDTQCRIRRYTPAVKDLLEVIPSDLGRPLSDLAPKFADVDLMADTKLVLETLIPIEREVRSNSDSWYSRRALPYRTADNRINGVVITFIDITERKNAEQQVRSAYGRLQAVVDQMPAAVMIVDAPSGKLTLVNREVSRLFKHPFPFPFIGSEWTSIFSIFKSYLPDGRSYNVHEWPLARSLQTGETIVDQEIEFDLADGTRGTLSASTAPVLDKEGTPIAVVATFWEISERKRNERALIESEERFRLLVDGARDYAIFLVDVDGRVATWNKGAQRLLGYTAEEIIGKLGATFFTPEDRAAAQPEAEMSTADRQGRAADVRWHVRKDGTRFWANGTMTRLDEDLDEKPRGFVKVLRDDTEAKDAAESLRKSKLAADRSRAIAETANRTKDDFVATVSHELRTPLSAILLWAKMLRSDRSADDELKGGLDIILRSAASQQQLIEDLLDVSRMTTGKLRITTRATNLSQAVNTAVESIVPIADARGVSVTANLDDVGVVRADPDRLQQVVWNVLNNAVKFTPLGGKVQLKLEREAELVLITVTDSGIGIEPDFLPHVFDQFSQAESGSTRAHSGLGLGLTIAQQLVELHNGNIAVTSDGKGKGATFTVSLPLAPLSVDIDDADVGTSLEDRQGEGLLTKTRVLLVEDEPDTRDAVQVFLERHGADVLPAATTADALKLFTSLHPDLIMSDIAMPGEDGYSLIRQIRIMEKTEKRPATPAVAMTAYARDDDRDRARKAGFQEHLSKPVEPNLLIDVVARLLKKSDGKSTNGG